MSRLFPSHSRFLASCLTFCSALLPMLLDGCASRHAQPPSQQLTQQCAPATAVAATPACPVCPACPTVEVAKPAAKTIELARWEDLPGWPGSGADGLAPAFSALLASCNTLQKQAVWQAPCIAAKTLDSRNEAVLRAWFETQLQPWQLVNTDGSREGLITGYYEPILKGSRTQKKPYLHPIHAVPDDLIDVELSELYPELKHMRLRGRLDGRKLVPYFSRADWSDQEARKTGGVLLWADDVLDVFFMQIQGSGQIQLDDGSRVRMNYADQNGHPYRSIGRWLIDQGELKAEQASMQGIRAWLKAHPKRVQELLNANPSYVFFRELPINSEGPPGAMGIPLTTERSIAVDPKFTQLGVPIWLATSYPNSERPLTRLVLAQDTGGAIRGAVRADFFWGSGSDAGAQAGKMRQKGQMWTLLPRGYLPPAATK